MVEGGIYMSMKLSVSCIVCTEVSVINVDDEVFNNWLDGEGLIQKVLPALSEQERDIVLTNMCRDCLDKMYAELYDY